MVDLMKIAVPYAVSTGVFVMKMDLKAQMKKLIVQYKVKCPVAVRVERKTNS